MSNKTYIKELNQTYNLENDFFGLTYNSSTDNFSKCFYRVRVVDEFDKILNVNQLSYPKSNVKLGRCNFENEPVFYCSDNPKTAILEVFKGQNYARKSLYLSVWSIKPKKVINIFPLLDRAYDMKLLEKIDPFHIIPDKTKKQIAKERFDKYQKCFYEDNYLESARISKLIFENPIIPSDCIFYPSAIKKDKGVNISVRTDYFDKNFLFSRAYRIDIESNNCFNIKNIALNSSDSSDILDWRSFNSKDLLIKTIINMDLIESLDNKFNIMNLIK